MVDIQRYRGNVIEVTIPFALSKTVRKWYGNKTVHCCMGARVDRQGADGTIYVHRCSCKDEAEFERKIREAIARIRAVIDAEKAEEEYIEALFKRLRT